MTDKLKRYQIIVDVLTSENASHITSFLLDNDCAYSIRRVLTEYEKEFFNRRYGKMSVIDVRSRLRDKPLDYIDTADTADTADTEDTEAEEAEDAEEVEDSEGEPVGLEHPIDQKIMAILQKKGGSCKTGDFAKLKVSAPTLYDHLKKLKELGHIVHAGRGRYSLAT